jgi:UDP-N-acetylglucosamine 2-epimerase (non-hydrolysing)
MKIISVVGARPNFMKIAPIYRAFKQLNSKNSKLDIQHLVCHTGQHYDEKMSKVFFKELELPKPDFYLGVGGGSHAEQTAKIMMEFEKVLISERPDLVIVVGDVNSTIACSLTAVKLNIKVAHVEAGLRSFDRNMPEEINRILTDSISDYLFVTEESGLENLKNEGIPNSKVFFVGHVMIDSLVHYLPKVVQKAEYKELSDREKNTKPYLVDTEPYILVTMHRPSNVDYKEKLSDLFDMLNRLAKKRKIIFPVHPRTKQNIKNFGLINTTHKDLMLTDPIGYLDFISLIKNAEVILTDSGGIQEESTYLGVQCVTLRTSTERPITVQIGTNHLVGDDFIKAERVVEEILKGKYKIGKIPELWDGKASKRIADILFKKIIKSSK